jgi:hypothetical protein
VTAVIAIAVNSLYNVSKKRVNKGESEVSIEKKTSPLPCPLPKSEESPG